MSTAPMRKANLAKAQRGGFKASSTQASTMATSAGNLQVLPGAIEFTNVALDTVYVMAISIKNKGNTMSRIRIEPPKTKHFSVHYVPSGPVAPGISITADVEFVLPTAKSSPLLEYTDVLTVVDGATRVEIPLKACLPTAKVVHQRSLDFGMVAKGSTLSQDLVLRNQGLRDAAWSIAVDEGVPLSFTPSSGTLKAASSTPSPGDPATGPNEAAVAVKLVQPQELGPFRCVARLQVEGQAASQAIDVSAQVVSQQLQLVYLNSKRGIRTVDFGHTLYGEEASIEALLVNDGPQPVPFFISCEEDHREVERMAHEIAAEHESESGPPPRPEGVSTLEILGVSPTDGTVAPYSSQRLTFRFSPVAVPPTKGFKRSQTAALPVPYAVRAVIDSAETSQSVTVPVCGLASVTGVEVSHRVVRFGPCPVHDRRDVVVSVSNTSLTALPFHFERVAHFDATPARGTLQPLQSLSVVLAFRPSQLGEFRCRLPLVVSGGERLVVPIRVVGSARTVSESKPSLKGGIDKLPRDFEPERRFIQSQPRHGQPGEEGKAWLREKPWETVDLLNSASWDENEVAQSATTHLTYSVQEIERRAIHRETYVQYLRRSQAARAERQRLRSTAEHEHRGLHPDGVNLGMERGLDEPELTLPPPDDADGSLLWLRHPGKPGSGGGGGGRGRLPTDDTKLIAKKCKPAPSTQAEVRDCAAELSAEDLRKLAVSHKTVDFGRVCVNSVSARSLSFANDLSRAVLVELAVGGEPELQQSGPRAQVVPAGGLAGFDVVFSSPREQAFRRTLQYTVNGRHATKVAVVAEVVPIELRLSRAELRLRFPDGSLEPSVAERVRLENPGNASAEFFWASRGPFAVTPEQGRLDPFGAVEVEVVWTPQPGQANSQRLALHVPGGEDRELSVVGELEEARCGFAARRLEFGTVAVGLTQRRTVEVRNTGEHDAVCTVESFDPSTGLVVEPERCMVPVGEAQRLTVTLTPPAARGYAGLSVQVHVRGSKLLKLPLVADAVVPRVEYLPQPQEEEGSGELAFQDVTIGNSEWKHVTLVNRGSIDASLTLDLTKHPEFRVSRAPHAISGLDEQLLLESAAGEAEAEQAPVPPEPTAAQQRHRPRPVVPAEQQHGGAEADGEAKNNNNNDDDEEASTVSDTELFSMERGVPVDEARRLRVAVGRHRAITLRLEYTPVTAARHDLRLPLLYEGIPDRSLQRRVTGVGVRPRLVMSRSTVDFGDRVVATDPSRRVPFSQELTFTNSHNTGIGWELDDSALKQGVDLLLESGSTTPTFFVSPREGDLAPGESVTLRVTFSPQGNQDYEARLPVFLADQADRSRPYLNLTLRGSGVYPRLDFSSSEVRLQTVPLGVKSCGRFEVINNGFDQLELSHRLPLHIPVQLQVDYPNGKALGVTMDRVAVMVSFQSDTPVSFHTNLELVDSEGHSHTVAIVGCADNSVLTTHSFLRSYAETFGYYTHEGRPVQYLSRQVIAAHDRHEIREKERARKARAAQRALEGGKRLSSEPGGAEGTPALTLQEELARVKEEGVDVTREADPLDPCLAPFLVLWLNASVLSTPISRFPEDMVASHGARGFDAVEGMCGRRVPGRLKRGGPTGPRAEHWRQLVEQYRCLLHHLKERGALLNGTLPRHLLGCADYVRAMEEETQQQQQQGGRGRLTPVQLRAERERWEGEHASLSAQHWTAVVLQSVRIFVLARVNPKSFAALPGMLLPPSHSDEDSHSDDGGGVASRKGKKKKKKPSSGGDPELVRSNVYTVSEGLLLRWASYHVNATTPASALPKRLTDFEASWSDGAVLCHCLQSHVPSLVDEEGCLRGFTPVTAGTAELRRPEVRARNVERLNAALAVLHAGLAVPAEAVSSAHPVVSVLAALHLYSFLPQMLPRTTVDFGATLGTPCLKQVELRNPERQPVRYRCLLEGSPDFTLPSGGDGGDGGHRTVTVPAKGSAELEVCLLARFSRPVEARLTLLAERTGPVAASHMVFVLRSRVESRRAAESREVRVECYHRTDVEFEVRNPFDRAASFDLALVQSTLESSLLTVQAGRGGGPPPRRQQQQRRANKQQQQQQQQQQRSEEEREAEAQLGRPFTLLSSPTVRLEAKCASRVKVQCLAFAPGVYRMELVAVSEEVGEIMYECIAHVGLPRPVEKITLQVQMAEEGMSVQRLLRLPAKNTAIDAACSALLERMPNNQRTKARTAMLSACKPALPGAGGAPNYSVEADSPYFSVSRGIVIDTEPRKTGPSSQLKPAATVGRKTVVEELTPETGVNDPNSLLLSFSPRAAGTYPCRLVISGAGSAAMDIRILEVEAVVTAPVIDTTLEFKVPARQRVVQEIPVVNSGAEEWRLSASIKGATAHFSGPSALTVPGGGKPVNYPLSFHPSWVCEGVRGTLVLRNQKTSTVFEYHLQGSAEEPLAEDHVVRHCNAREPIEFVFKVPHFVAAKAQSLVCDVESDMPFVCGADKVEVGPQGAEYSLQMLPQMGGTYNGSITFKAPGGEYIWYTMEATVDSPLEDKIIELSTTVRKVVSVAIELENPLDEPIEFDVLLKGDGVLGSNHHRLEPAGAASSPYELFYSPLVAREGEGSVVFLNDKVGEFWYKLRLLAEEAETVKLEVISSPLGGSARAPVTVENPLAKSITLTATTSNRTNFAVHPPQIEIGPYGAAVVNVVYTPSSLSELESGEVSLTHPELGAWRYLVQGRGELPGVMDTHTPTTTVGEGSSYMFTFRNPFKQLLHISVFLRTEKDADSFSLLMKNTSDVPIAPFAALQIPISFTPRTIEEKSAMVEVRGTMSGHALCWVYPLKGAVNAPQYPKTFPFRCKAKAVCREVVDFPLRSLAGLRESETFTHELIVPESVKALVGQSLTVNPVKTTIADPTEPVQFQISFEPMKPFSTSVQLVVLRHSGGRWPFELQLDALEPDPDDHITIEAHIRTTATVNFKLVNRFDTFAPFHAYFSTDSSLALAVQPSSGLLGPAMGEGTTFSVSFSPMEYGKLQRGRLIIQTEETQWTYEITGAQPKTEVPKNVRAVVDTRLGAEVEQALGKHRAGNVIRRNINTTAHSPPATQLKSHVESPNSRVGEKQSKFSSTLD